MSQILRKLFYPVLAAVVLSGPMAYFAATPALASVVICEKSGPYCMNAPSLTGGTPIVERTSGTPISIVDTGNARFKLELSSSKCVGVSTSNDSIVEVKSCTANATLWNMLFQDRGGVRWINYYESQRSVSTNLSGAGSNGSKFRVQVAGDRGWLQVFK